MNTLRRLFNRWTLIVPALGLALAGCQAPAPGSDIDLPPPLPAEDSCGATAHEALIGTAADKIDMSAFPEGTRLLYPTSPMTMDFRPDRLNIHANKDGKIIRLSCN